MLKPRATTTTEACERVRQAAWICDVLERGPAKVEQAAYLSEDPDDRPYVWDLPTFNES